MDDDAKPALPANNSPDALSEKIAANELRIAENDRMMRLARYQIAHAVASLADVAHLGSLEALREDFCRRRRERLPSDEPLLEPYLASLLARHLPLDDWAESTADLSAQTLDAIRDEIDDLASVQEMPPRLLLLLDALVDIAEFHARPAPE